MHRTLLNRSAGGFAVHPLPVRQRTGFPPQASKLRRQRRLGLVQSNTG